MEFNKKQKSITAVYLIVLVVYNVLFFAVPFPKTAACVIVYVFFWIAAVVSYMVVIHAFPAEDTLRSKVYGFPVLRLGYWYLLIQFTLSAIFNLLAFMISVPAWVAVVLCILLLGAVLIGVIATDSTRDTIQQIQQEEEIHTRQMTYFRLDLSAYVDRSKSPDVKKSLQKLAEKFRYSDPVSSEELREIEEQLQQEVERLGDLINAQDALAMEQIERVDAMLEDRNRRCKAGKR